VAKGVGVSKDACLEQKHLYVAHLLIEAGAPRRPKDADLLSFVPLGVEKSECFDPTQLCEQLSIVSASKLKLLENDWKWWRFLALLNPGPPQAAFTLLLSKRFRSTEHRFLSAVPTEIILKIAKQICFPKDTRSRKLRLDQKRRDFVCKAEKERRENSAYTKQLKMDQLMAGPTSASTSSFTSNEPLDLRFEYEPGDCE
jgi:hypothetical protein